jgi:hypothetical protein
MSSTPELKLDWCSHEAAKYACEKWHYAKRMLVGKTAKIGVWEGGAFRGCVIFAPGSSGVGNIGPSMGMPTEQVCELQRVALADHVAPVSRIVSIALRLVRREFPKIRLVVSYADPAEGHHGGIYQAMGWVYVGLSAATPIWVGPDGRTYHDRNVTASGSRGGHYPSKRCGKKSECRKFVRPAKYKYYLSLDADMRAKVLPLSKPYPKRAASSAGAAPANHAGEGGSTPTAALSKRQQ